MSDAEISADYDSAPNAATISSGNPPASKTLAVKPAPGVPAMQPTPTASITRGCVRRGLSALQNSAPSPLRMFALRRKRRLIWRVRPRMMGWISMKWPLFLYVCRILGASPTWCFGCRRSARLDIGALSDILEI